ncbi:ABC transporter permease [Urechidicola vernalis]|uniref:Transport permease protein n=1 Tax=Urechidicola vernalis TaxID=3075600 RepID=A0ABU2Y2M2_9FLAO|nr:ABC transporter permease [Urechidicola sp. P050]MDT0552282.1 ABC transporter permease [Urechidicola sp. P050]
MNEESPKEEWLYEITPKNSLFSLNLKEVWQYRDLLFLFVKRNIITTYKQTILGPLWYLIQPVLTALTFTLIFNKIANIDTGSVPPFLFNMVGITTWGYFKSCLTGTSDTFKGNAGIFSKVYFPRMIMPLVTVITNLFRFGIQLLILSGFYLYYFYNGASISLNSYSLLFPVLIILMGLLGLGLGMIISSMITKYRDLKFLLNFGVQLLMYVSAVMYPISLVQEKLPKFAWLVEYNPMAYVIEAARYMILSDGNVVMSGLVYTALVTLVVLFIGILIFNKTEKSFIDTI